MEALGTTLGECIVLEAVCVHHLCLLHVFANTDEGTQTRTRSTHSVHINPQTHIPRLIPLQLRPIRARVKGSLRGGGRTAVFGCSTSRITSSHWYADTECERETGTKGET